MVDKDIARSIMTYDFWNIYGKFDMVSAMKRTFIMMDRGYLFVDELINVIKDEAEKKRFKAKYPNVQTPTWLGEEYGWFE